jgi:hypothetical protein
MLWLKKESEFMGMLRKSSIDIIGGPAGMMNKIEITAASYVGEVVVATLTFTSAGRSR